MKYFALKPEKKGVYFGNFTDTPCFSGKLMEDSIVLHTNVLNTPMLPNPNLSVEGSHQPIQSLTRAKLSIMMLLRREKTINVFHCV